MPAVSFISSLNWTPGSFVSIAPNGPILDADDYRRRFPDGRIGSDPSQATPEKGERLIAAAAKALVTDFEGFMRAS